MTTKNIKLQNSASIRKLSDKLFSKFELLNTEMQSQLTDENLLQYTDMHLTINTNTNANQVAALLGKANNAVRIFLVT